MNDIDSFLKEDLGDEGDITSNSLFIHELSEAKIIAKENCVVAGLDEVKEVFEKVGVNVECLSKDGDFIKKGTVVVKTNGFARSILKAERLALNIISRMSGIATETKKLVDLCRPINPNVKIAATRKTTPGFRKYEKKAVIIGGGEPHRYGLYDAILIKDNHIKIAGSVEKTIKKIQEKIKNKIIEIEVENEKDAITAAKLDVGIIMLDNFEPKQAEQVAEKIKKINNNILIEVSGGINLENITKYASFSDRISLGYITHSVRSKDFSLEMEII